MNHKNSEWVNCIWLQWAYFNQIQISDSETLENKRKKKKTTEKEINNYESKLH